MRLKKICYAALLTAGSLITFLIEAQLPALTPIPGIKPGLSNIFTLFALCRLGRSWAFAVLFCRIFLGCLVTGQLSALPYSLSGGLLSLLLCCLLKKLFPADRLWVLSVFSAMTHNIGQILCAVVLTQTPALFFYLPLLLISAIISGAFTGIAAQSVLQRLSA